MRKMFISSIFFIIIGFLLGNFIFTNQDFFKNIKTTDTYYILQEGVYTDKTLLNSNLNKLKQKTIDYYNEKYHVYVGITKDLEVYEKLKTIYEKNGYKIFQKQKNIKSLEFSSNVSQFDFLIKQTDEEDEILTIEEVVLANYDEILKKQS